VIPVQLAVVPYLLIAVYNSVIEVFNEKGMGRIKEVEQYFLFFVMINARQHVQINNNYSILNIIDCGS